MRKMGTQGWISAQGILWREVPLSAGSRAFFATRASNLVIYGLEMHLERSWPHCRIGQDQICDRAGTSRGVPTCAGDALAPPLIRSGGGSSEPGQRGGGCHSLGRAQRGCPGWVWPITPRLPPASLPQQDLRGIPHRKRFRSCSASLGLSVLLPREGSHPVPHPPGSPCPCVHSCWQLSCTYSQWQGHGVLLYSAACCATPGCTSRKHRASHDHGTGSCPAGPSEGWHRQGARKAAWIPKTGSGDLGSGGKDGFDPPRQGEDPCPGSIGLCCHTRKETKRKEKNHFLHSQEVH